METKINAIIASLVAALLCISLPVMAQGEKEARKVLDQTASVLKGSGGIEASFEASVFKGTQLQGSTSGTICIKENKFYISSPELLTWFDGKSQWVLLKNSDEVNVSTPTVEEVQKSNPYTFVNLYKKGYTLQLAEADYNGSKCYEATLTAQSSRQHIQEMRITIDKNSYLPLSIRIREGKNSWTRIRVKDIKTKRKWNDDFFRFNSKDYPKVEIIDLR